jgi:hypothetical protein
MCRSLECYVTILRPHLVCVCVYIFTSTSDDNVKLSVLNKALRHEDIRPSGGMTPRIINFGIRWR